MKDVKNLEAELISKCDIIINAELSMFTENAQIISEDALSYKNSIGKKMAQEAGTLIHEYLGFINLESLNNVIEILRRKALEFNFKVTELLNQYNKE